jgi:hypothetical protein
MQNTHLIITGAQMALENEASVQGARAVIRLGFDPSKLSAKSNRQTKASIRSRKKMKGKPTLGETTEKKYLRNCDEKTRFKSLEHAKEAKERIRYISAMESADGKPATRLPSRAYACGNCKGWHLSSRADLFEVKFELAA